MLDDILNDDWSVVDDGLEELDVSILRDTHPFELMSQNREYQSDQQHFLFVYGSMKRGFPNHSRLTGRPNNEFIGEAKTTGGGYLMGSRTSSNNIVVPMVNRHGGGTFNIIGEMYSVDGPTIFNLDLAEGCPDVYVRKNVGVNMNGSLYSASMYLFVDDFDFHIEYPSVVTEVNMFNSNDLQEFRCKAYER